MCLRLFFDVLYCGDGENEMTAGSCEPVQNVFFHILVRAELIEGWWGKQEVGGGLLGDGQSSTTKVFTWTMNWTRLATRSRLSLLRRLRSFRGRGTGDSPMNQLWPQAFSMEQSAGHASQHRHRHRTRLDRLVTICSVLLPALSGGSGRQDNAVQAGIHAV